MKTRFGSLLVAVAMAATLHAAEVQVGQVVSVKGQAVAIGEGGPRDLALKSPVFVNDQVVTHEASSLQLLFTDDSTISQGANSRMAVDEYVYAPGRKTNNMFSANLGDGLFRVVTDKIARENADGVRVKTRMATMAVRGCDVVFWVASGDVEVLVLALEGAHEVVIQRTGDGSSGQAGGNTLSIHDAGTVAIVRAGMDMEEGHISDAGLASFLGGLTSQNTGGSGGQNTSGTSQDPSQGPPPKPPPQVTPPVTHLASTSSAPPPSPPSGANALLDNTVAPTRIFVPRDGGSDWSWGDWETGGVIDSYEFASASVLAVADYASIVAGAKVYALSGVGVAAASILHNGSTAAVEGPCTLSVVVGGGLAPTWDGSFVEANGNGDSLKFDAEGTIESDGRLTGNHSAGSYSMKVHGVSFGENTISVEQIGGRLVGSGSGATPITGTVGNYSFSHGGQATVNGGFGADLH